VPDDVRVIVTGSRSWPCGELAVRVVGRLQDRYGEALVIVHGGARGVDAAFDAAARRAGVRVEAHPAEWDRLGRAAGPKRNARMVARGARFAVAVHPDLAGSMGTRDCVRRCLEAEIPVWLIDAAQAEPRRIRAV
jgi:hypothetical protein